MAAVSRHQRDTAGSRPTTDTAVSRYPTNTAASRHQPDNFFHLQSPTRPHQQYSENTSRRRDVDTNRRDKDRQDHHDVLRGNGDKHRQDDHDGHRSGDDGDGRIDRIQDSISMLAQIPMRLTDRMGVGRHAAEADYNARPEYGARPADNTRALPPYLATTSSARLNAARSERPSLTGDEGYADDSDGDDDLPDEGIAHIQCWIPGEDIDLTVLATYLKDHVDDTATIRQSRSPQARDKTGFTISARATISVAGLTDIIKDSKLWAVETNSREFRRDPYPYTDSDTYVARKRSGPTPGHQNRARRRRPNERRI